jgi:hypothetical protein
VSLGSTAEKLREAGVETLGIVGTPVDRARKYFRYRRPRCRVGSDPELATHRAFGVPRTAMTPELWGAITRLTDDLARDVGLEIPAGDGHHALDRADGIDPADYLDDEERHQMQFTAQFLVDREGVIRWASVECADGGLQGLDVFPSDEELLAAARAL